MSEPASISSGIARRYAAAAFDLAQEGNQIDDLERDANAITEVLSESEALREMVSSPLYGRDEQQAAIGALAGQMGLGDITANTLRLMASKRRLFVLQAFAQAVRDMIAEAKGEVRAEITSAQPLSDDQRETLARTLRTKIGKDIKITTTVDESLIGGLVVKVGSQMIDTSVAAKLANLQNSMKEVG